MSPGNAALADSATTQSSDHYEFGPFRLDVSTRALYCSGEFVPVTPKVFDTLCLLVEEAGRVVSKEHLLARVWPDAYVEEGSIANNISVLRKILNPHFDGEGPIATVARRGYRFTAPVYVRSGPARPASGVHPIVAEPEQAPSATPIAAVALASRRRLVALLTALALVAGLAGALVWQRRATSGGPAVSPIRRSVAVLPMKNLSEDTDVQWFSTALAETISAELAAGGHFRTVSGENVIRMQQELAPPAGLGLTRKQLDDIGRDLACDLVLTGNYLVVGGQVRVDVRLEDVATGETVVSASVTEPSERLLDLVARAGADLRTKLGLDQPSADDSNAVRAAFASNPEALRPYFLGLEALRLRDGPKARAFLSAAVTADPSFALAHSALSTTWRLLGYDQRGADEARLAFDLSARLSPEDRLSVEAQLHEATSSWSKAVALYRQLWDAYPDNVEYGLKLANVLYLGGRSPEALVVVEKMRTLPGRDRDDPRIDLLEATVADRVADNARASAAAARAAEKAQAVNARVMLARARIKQGVYASRRGDNAEALRYFADAEQGFAAVGEEGGVADAIRWQGQTLFTMARYEDADAVLDRAFDLSERLNYVRLSTEIRLLQGALRRQRGDLDGAARLAEEAIGRAREADNRSATARGLVNLGVAQTSLGERARARESYEEAIRVAESGDDVGVRNTAVNNLANLSFILGALDEAERGFTAALAEDRRIGNKTGVALRLGNLARVVALRGHTARAETLVAEECQLQEALGAALNLAGCRTRLAELHLELGRPDAAAMVRAIQASDLGATIMSPVSLARLASLQLASGDRAAAAATLARAERVVASTRGPIETVTNVSTVRALLDAATGNRTTALRQLKNAIAAADAAGVVTAKMEASLALASIDPGEAPAVEQTARAAGFTAIADKARGLSARARR